MASLFRRLNIENDIEYAIARRPPIPRRHV